MLLSRARESPGSFTRNPPKKDLSGNKDGFVADLPKRKDKGVHSWLIGLSGKLSSRVADSPVLSYIRERVFFTFSCLLSFPSS